MHRFSGLIATVAILVLFVVGTATAQRMRMTAEERADTLAKQLSLTDEQKAKILDIYKKSDESRRAAFDNAAGDRSAMREAMQKIREESDAKIKAVLTKEQAEKWEKIRAQAPGRRGPPGM
jgi:protein CpxP